MMLLLATTAAPTAITIIFLVLAVGLALGFEFVNGFHDTANAVATVIYTNTLKATPAVIWSGTCNFLGVLTSSGAVAFGIVALLPVELVINVGSTAGFAMVFALLLSAIIWNLGTWYLGLPASSSHTLIGSIMGVGLANSLMQAGAHGIASGINWAKAKDIGMALLVSPLVGFFCAAALYLLIKVLVHKPELYESPKPNTPPPWWIRGILLFTCTGVSFFHGSNDGQKGMGLIVLILVGILPGYYALKMDTTPETVHQIVLSSQSLAAEFAHQAGGAQAGTPEEATKTISAYLKSGGKVSPQLWAALSAKTGEIYGTLASDQHANLVKDFDDIPEHVRRTLRTDFYLLSGAIKKLSTNGQLTNPATKKAEMDFASNVEKITNYIPPWVKVAVALALGFGTMIGYKRIVVTVGEKIGKSHLTYAQGASAELVAMLTIWAADIFGLPVSTTHVLSSGVAGTMAASGSGLQASTLRNILLAWVLTLPVCVFLGAMLFAFGLNLLFLLGLH